MQKRNLSVLEIILSAIAIVLSGSIFLKAIIDLDRNYDVGWYHLPFSARIWGIIPASSFISENLIEHRFDGFPLLTHFFQGLLWKITGHIQATNLVCYLSLVIYFYFLQSYFKVPLYLSVIALFSIPTVLTHAATSLVDLPGNIGVSVVMMILFCWFRESKLPNRQEFLAAFLGSAMAINTKPQLQPLVFVLFLVGGIRLVWLYFKNIEARKRKLKSTITLAVIASMLIFATPIKNVALYGNPFYPIKIEIAGIVLNHQLTPETYNDGDRPQKWLQSIFEINTPRWSADQWNGGNEKKLDRAGGFFGAYVVFNLLLLLGMAIQEQLNNWANVQDKSRNAITALGTILLVSLIPANFPQSHELRYFMFWMITLVSLNLALVSSSSANPIKWLQPKYLGLVCLLFLTIVCSKIDRFYLKPNLIALNRYLNNNIKQELVEQMVPNQRSCLIARHAIINPNSVPYASIANAFFYSSYFHSELGYDYQVRASVDPKDCEELPVIPSNAAEFIEP